MVMARRLHYQPDIVFPCEIYPNFHVLSTSGVDHIDWISFSAARIVSVGQASVVISVVLNATDRIFCVENSGEPFCLDSRASSAIKSRLTWMADGTWGRRLYKAAGECTIKFQPRRFAWPVMRVWGSLAG